MVSSETTTTTQQQQQQQQHQHQQQQQQQHKPPHVKELPFPVLFDIYGFCGPHHGHTAERRLRAHLWYARMSVAMALAEATHHTAPRGQRTARSGKGPRYVLHSTFRNMSHSRRPVPGTLRWTPGSTLGRHQPPGGQHRCLRPQRL